MIDWNDVWSRIEPALGEVVAEVKEAHPGILGGVYWSRATASQWFPFQAMASFVHDPSGGNEQLLVQFRCSESCREVWVPEVWPYFPSEVAARHAVGVAIETGRGEILAALPPQLLPEDEAGAEYREAVLRYIDRAVTFLREHRSVIITATAPAADPGRLLRDIAADRGWVSSVCITGTGGNHRAY
jgi:hypothetical protein